ncbi:DMT family transporter [Pseudogracilibacillus sp. SO30301A]|uniref:DMT family transporter n=1 Tax=Pseudogracilibacillus sp. SO30301A TaxID=3098291 RepID=UPI00300E5C56
MDRSSSILFLLFATILWGGNFVIGRAVISELPPFTLAFWRWCIAFMVFYPFAWSFLKRDWNLIRKHLVPIFFMALTGVASYSSLIYIALHKTTTINAAIMNTTAPVIIFIISFIFLKERLTMIQIVGTAISLIGVLFIISKGSFMSLLNVSFNIGDLFVLIAVIAWSIYSVLTKKFSSILPGHSTFFISMLFGILILLPLFILESVYTTHDITWSFMSIFAVFYTGICASVVAYICWNIGVIKLGASYAGVFMNFIPVFATLFAFIFINEALKVFQIMGGFFVFMGVFLTMYSKSKRV